jgi:ATP-dependent helicase/nuclease subunit A
MPERGPTPEQLAAIRVVGSATVRAGAGAGKTRVLSEHFLHLLRGQEGQRPPVEQVSEILAITFTEKAAAEMKTKIRVLLAAEAAQARAPERPRWERARRELLGAQISTIHAFCHRVIRENPIEAAVDPAAVLLDEHESRAWLESAVEDALTLRVRAGDPGGQILVGRFGLRRGRDGGAVGHVMRLLARLAATGRRPEWVVEATAAQAARAPTAEQAIRDASDRLVEKIEAVVGGKSQAPRVVRLREEWPAWAPLLRRLGGETPRADILRLAGLVRLLSNAVPHVKHDLGLDEGKLVGVIPASWGALAGREPSAAVAALLADVARSVRARRDMDGVLTFDDLILEAYAVLTRHPAVRDRYARRFRAILVDEFQDTDAVQAGLVQALAGDTVPLFVVGDEKQSIYGFRGADVSVFHAMRERLGNDLSLGTNFRSQPAILRFVNELAAATLRRPPNALDPAHWIVFDETQRLVPDRSQTWAGPGVRLVSFVAEQERQREKRGGDISTSEMRELEARALAGVIRRLHDADGVRFGGITVLFRALTDVKLYEHALRRGQIPYYVVKGRGFFQCQEIRDLLSLLAAVANAEDALALAAVLRSPFFGFDDDTLARLAWPPDRERPDLARRFRSTEIFADVPEQARALGRARDLLVRLRRLASRATIAELLEEALAATDFEAVCLTQFQGTQKVANVRKLIELARDAERRRRFGLRQFVAWGRELEAHEPREPEATLVGEQDDVVRLMTIHQAKGLEFDVVVVPDLARRLDFDRSQVALDDDLGVIVQRDDGGVGHLPNAWLTAYRKRQTERSAAEHARLLYVACTRARDHLVLLEGKGDLKRLQSGKTDPHVWVDQVWQLLGCDAIRDAARAPHPQTTIALPNGGEVLVERAEVYLGAGTDRVPETPEPIEAEPRADDLAAVARVLGFRPPPAPEVVTSPTALADFRRCPRQYWYRQVLGLPERGRSGARMSLLGTAAHAVMERLDLADPEADVERRVEASPEALLLRDAERAALVADLRLAARALAAELAAGLELVGREVPFVLPLPRRDPKLFLSGRLDVLARRAGRHVVRDFKYAAPSDAGVAQYGAQLGAYQLAVLSAGGEHADGELVFLRGGTTVRPLPAIEPAAEEEALVGAGAALGLALADGTPDAFPKTPEGPRVCEALGCGYVRRCWDRSITRTAGGPPTRTFAS